jgi:hypothetical protein
VRMLPVFFSRILPLFSRRGLTKSFETAPHDVQARREVNQVLDPMAGLERAWRTAGMRLRVVPSHLPDARVGANEPANPTEATMQTVSALLARPVVDQHPVGSRTGSLPRDSYLGGSPGVAVQGSPPIACAWRKRLCRVGPGIVPKPCTTGTVSNRGGLQVAL